MSGGAVLNQSGEVVAIHGRGDRERNANGELGQKTGFNLGIPINRFATIAANLGVNLEQKLTPISPDRSPKADDYFALANQKYEKGNYRGALADYDRAIALKPDYAKAYRARSTVKSGKIGDPQDPTTEQGPQIDKAQFDKIMDYIGRGTQQGAKCVSGGQRYGDTGYFIEPTVFTNVKDEMDIAKNEIFGPVLSVFKFRDVDEIIKRANDTMFGLAAAVWTRDISKAHRIANELKAGTVWINCYDVFDAAAPFGGYKMSGMGRELGAEGLKAYLETKTVTVAL